MRSLSRSIESLLLIALAALFLVSPDASGQQPKQNMVAAPPALSLSSDKATVSACSGSGMRVQLNARATSPSGNPIKYSWSTTGGRITGNGPLATWDLTDVTPGVYKTFVEIATGTTNDECYAFTSTTVVVKPCFTTQTVCPNIEIIPPTNIVVDQPLTFSSSVSGGGAPLISPIYNWTVSAGKITEGQGTSSIKIDATGLAGQTINAALSMGGYTLNCSASSAVSIPVPGPKPHRFDAFPDISRNDEKARLDNLVVELQNDPKATAYVIVYPVRSGKRGDVQNHAIRILDYLVSSRGIDSQRIVILVGAAREQLRVELWTCAQGATPPNP